MAKALKIEVQGAKALIKGLKKLSTDARSIVEEEIEIGVQDIRTDAVANAPVDTGLLRASITAQSQGLEGEVATNVPYAGFMEFGTGGEVNIQPGWEDIAEQYRGKGNQDGQYQAAPVHVPCIEKNAPRIIKTINKRIDDELKEIMELSEAIRTGYFDYLARRGQRTWVRCVCAAGEYALPVLACIVTDREYSAR